MMTVRGLPPLLLVFGLLSAMGLWSSLRLLFPTRFRTLRPNVFLALCCAGLLLLQLAMEYAGRFFAPMGGGAWRVPLAISRVTVTAGLGLLFVSLFFYSAFSLLLLLVRSLRALRARAQASSEAEAKWQTRREMLGKTLVGMAMASGVSLAIYGGRTNVAEAEVTEHEVHLPGLPTGLEGLTLVQLTDVHVGPFVGEHALRALVDRVRALRPDVVVLTGDLIDFDARLVPETMRVLQGLQARMGVWSILGNHDYYAGAAIVREGLRRAGFNPLVNQGAMLGENRDRIALLGLDDLRAPRHGGRGPELASALRTVSEELPRIVLAHNPQCFAFLRGQCGLQLSGHTHGGQINPAGMTRLMLPYVAGWYRENGSAMYVSRGLGFTGPPVRLASAPEIAKFGLTGRSRG